MLDLRAPRSPLSVVYSAIVLSVVLGAGIQAALLLGWLSPFWSRTVIILEGMALLIALLASRWRPSWRLLFYPLLLGYLAYVWDPTLPPPHLQEGSARIALPLAAVVSIIADLLLPTRGKLPFRPGQIEVHGSYVNLDKTAYFFRLPPDVVRIYAAREGGAIKRGRSGEEYIALADLQRVVELLAREREQLHERRAW
ncbi:MAG TPA: hypothetical protein PKD53_02935 [Chloroflexaceae bacterium]|nr:hypothetical protein [Chloroflexaceae bacterium]